MSNNLLFDLNDYEPDWREYRKVALTFWVILFSYLPGIAGSGGIIAWGFHSDIGYPIIGLIWLIASIRAAIKKGTWVCPRCGNPFFFRWIVWKSILASMPPLRPAEMGKNQR